MSFVKILPSDYIKLVPLLENRIPKSSLAYNVVQMKVMGIHPPSNSTSIYTFNDLVKESEDVFLVIVMERSINQDHAIIVSTPEIVTNEMNTAFEDFLNWDGALFFCAVDTAYSPTIIGLCRKYSGLDKVSKCDLLFLPLQEAKAIKEEDFNFENCPELTVSELSEADAKFVTDNWKFKSPGSEIMMAEHIKYIGSGGVYLNGEIVSCVAIFSMGSINALFTSDRVRGKGYGALTMRKVCQIAGKKGLIPNVQVEIGNEPSNKLMSKVGFKYSHQIEWIWYSSKTRKV